MNITAEDFLKAVGSLPQDDDLERCNCPESGTIGHYFCGWCNTHNRPLFYCGVDCTNLKET